MYGKRRVKKAYKNGCKRGFIKKNTSQREREPQPKKKTHRIKTRKNQRQTEK